MLKMLPFSKNQRLSYDADDGLPYSLEPYSGERARDWRGLVRSEGKSSSTADEGSRGTVLTETEHGSDSVPMQSPTPDGLFRLACR